MPLIIDNLRALFAQQLTDGKSLDRAMAHVITIAYERGLDDGRRSEAHALTELANNLLDPEMYGHAVTDEVRRAAKKALQT